MERKPTITCRTDSVLYHSTIRMVSLPITETLERYSAIIAGFVFSNKLPHRLTVHLMKHFTDNDFHCDRCCESPANNARPSIENRRDDVGRESCSQCGKLVVGVPSKQTCKHCGITVVVYANTNVWGKYVTKQTLKLKICAGIGMEGRTQM